MSEEEDAAAIGRKLAAAKQWVMEHKVAVASVLSFALGVIVAWLL